MSELELKRMKLELIKVSAAKAEIEFRIDERLDEIARLKLNIGSQVKREEELTAQIQAASSQLTE